jgi:plastocyanin
MKPAKRSSTAFLMLFTIIAMELWCIIGSGSASASLPASQPTTQPTATVKIENFTFEPRDLQIAVGTTVTWQNADDVPHTATSKDDPQTFDSGALDTDDKFSFTFSKPGKYAYYCKVHPHMQGVITVK